MHFVGSLVWAVGGFKKGLQLVPPSSSSGKVESDENETGDSMFWDDEDGRICAKEALESFFGGSASASGGGGGGRSNGGRPSLSIFTSTSTDRRSSETSAQAGSSPSTRTLRTPRTPTSFSFSFSHSQSHSQSHSRSHSRPTSFMMRLISSSSSSSRPLSDYTQEETPKEEDYYLDILDLGSTKEKVKVMNVPNTPGEGPGSGSPVFGDAEVDPDADVDVDGDTPAPAEEVFQRKRRNTWQLFPVIFPVR
jgi:hypothetical protein